MGNDGGIGAPVARARDAPGRRGARRGVRVFIVGAGAAAHLAGVVAAHTTLPVIGVPIDSSALKGLDALLSTVQMPPGVPVATVAIGKPGATNAGVLAAQMIALADRPWPGGSWRTRRRWRRRWKRRRAADAAQKSSQRLRSGRRSGDFGGTAEPRRCARRTAFVLRRAAVRTRRGCRGRGSCAPTRARRGRPGSCANAFTRSSDGRVNGMPGASLSGSRLTFALNAVEQSHEPPRVLRRVVHAVEQHVLERDARPPATGKPPARLHEVVQVVAPVDRHERRCASRRWSHAARWRDSA